MHESTKDELLDLIDRLDGEIFRLNSYIEDNENIDHATWRIIDTLIIKANVTLSKIKETIKYS